MLKRLKHARIHHVMLLIFAGFALFATTKASEGLPKLRELPIEQDEKERQSQSLIALGKKLFFDKRLSANGTISCASCHVPEKAFADGKPLALGIHNQLGTRNTPSLLNAKFNTSFFWDGRQDTLENQALDPILNPREHGIPDLNNMLNIIQNDSGYKKLFTAAFPQDLPGIGPRHVASALSAFERTLIAANSPFDRFYFGGDQSAISAAAKRGLKLFQGSAKCVSCHSIGKQSALFTDNEFHQLGVGISEIANDLPELTKRIVKLKEQNLSLDSSILHDVKLAELGRFAVTMRPLDIGRFRTPSLRNVALTAPYMHDGSIPTLPEAVELELYYRSTEIGYPLILTPAEKDDLVQFLETLNSPAALVPPHEWRASD
ncbi:cytochrome c peroxidase [Duganella sp. CF458]|uniref:cytochrome-c peroxidase n=1 Tax=Duganella sp. CF458 TaxID=1884368 RepID=UPI0008E6BF6C|nr:cytochrome c peroxidase [Duganella sp. CF458]SFG43715.1 cytochrome c peroxidase [Duganella sp. CF458]